MRPYLDDQGDAASQPTERSPADKGGQVGRMYSAQVSVDVDLGKGKGKGKDIQGMKKGKGKGRGRAAAPAWSSPSAGGARSGTRRS